MVIADGQRGLTLLNDGKWADARVALEAALRREEAPALLQGLGEALMWQGDGTGCIEYLQRAYTAHRMAGDYVSATLAAIYVGITYKCYLGNDAAAHGWLARAETAANDGDPTPVQGWLWAYRGFLTADHDTVQAEALVRRALEHARASGDRDLELTALGDLGVILAKSGRAATGTDLVDEAMAGISAGEHSHLETVVFVCCSMLIACQYAVDLARAAQWCRIADQFYDRYGSPYLYAECRTVYGAIMLALGRWEEAESQLTTAVSMTRDILPAVHVVAAAGLAELRLRQGRLEEAEALLDGLEHEVCVGLPLAALRIARGQTAAAIRILCRVLRYHDPASIEAVRALELLVHAHLLHGELQPASDALAPIQEAIERKHWPEAFARLELAAGRVAAYCNDAGTAIEHFEDAVAGFIHLDMPYEAASARMALAEAAREASPGLAASQAAHALDAFHRLGAQPGVDAAAALLRSLGQATGPGPRGPGLLTEREREVLALLECGLSNPEIAQRLFISRKTAAHHVSRVLAKLGVRNRAEAVAFASRLALQEPAGRPRG